MLRLGKEEVLPGPVCDPNHKLISLLGSNARQVEAGQLIML